jgi:branched-chain amino acid transport system substrate-binding protein
MHRAFRLGALVAATTLALANSAKADITIAVNGPITGPYAVFGDQMKRGAEFAAAELNAKGGLLGQQVKVLVGDDACDPKQAVSVANKDVTEGVKVVIGHYCSGSSIPASGVYQEAGILQITPASTNPKLTDDAAAKGWWNVFRTCGRDDTQGITDARYLAEHYKGKRIGVLHDKSPYGKGLADETVKGLEKAGIKPALYEAYNPGEKDYTAIITRLKSESIDVAFVGGYHTEVGLMLRQGQDAGFKGQWMSGDANATDELRAIAGSASDGFLMTFGPDQRNNPAAKDVVAAMRKSGFEPEGYTLYTVAAMQVWSAAAKAANSLEGKKVAEIIRGKSFDTVIGKLTYDQKGDILDPKYVVYVWKDGKYAELTK